MPIRQISLTNYRNLSSTTLDFHANVNLIDGLNGSGKSNLLEAMYILCQGKSFRTHQLKQCIKTGKDDFLLFGRFNDYKAGLSKSKTSLNIKINGEKISRRSELASKTPVKIINPDSFNLVSGTPKDRRLFIDWCLFHVEHQYTDHWIKFRHALKQRNQILKTRKDLNLLDYWDEYLCQPSEIIKKHRQKNTKLLNQLLKQDFNDLVGEFNITLEYQPGWPEQCDYKVNLEKNRKIDIRSGFTNSGIHRDNLLILSNGIPVSQVLSRGQLKRLCITLIITGLKIVSSRTGKPIMLLIDDMAAELDYGAFESLFQSLTQMDVQLFITGVESYIPRSLLAKEFKMFHVEHGIITPRKSS